MEPFVRLKPDGMVVAPGRKVIKAADYQAYLDAKSIVAEAREQAQRIVTEADEAYRRERERGYDDGQREASDAFAEQMIEVVSNTIDHYASVESTIVDLVMMAIKKILGDMEEKDRITKLVHHALTVVRNQSRVTLRVSPLQVDMVKESLGAITAGLSGIGFVDVVTDNRLGRGSCILETELGIVEASLDAQLAALHGALAKHLETEAPRPSEGLEEVSYLREAKVE